MLQDEQNFCAAVQSWTTCRKYLLRSLTSWPASSKRSSAKWECGYEKVSAIAVHAATGAVCVRFSRCILSGSPYAGGFNMPMDEEKRMSKGFAFVEFHTPEVRCLWAAAAPFIRPCALPFAVHMMTPPVRVVFTRILTCSP